MYFFCPNGSFQILFLAPKQHFQVFLQNDHFFLKLYIKFKYLEIMKIFWEYYSQAQIRQFRAQNYVTCTYLWNHLLDLFEILHKVRPSEQKNIARICFSKKVRFSAKYTISNPNIKSFTLISGSVHCICLNFCIKSGAKN